MSYKDPEKRKEYQRQYYEKRKEELKKKRREHYAENKEQYRNPEAQRRWYKKTSGEAVKGCPAVEA